VAKAACVVAYLAVAWLFGGSIGLAIGIAVVVARWAFGFATSWLWIGSIAALGAACVATFVQGLPTSSVVGPDFGAHHIAAHALVGASLALAAFAGLLEADRTRWRRPRRRRLVAARVGRRGKGVAVATTSSALPVEARPDGAPKTAPSASTPPGGSGATPDLRPTGTGPPAASGPPATPRPATRRRPRQRRPSPDPPPAPGTEPPPRP